MKVTENFVASSHFPLCEQKQLSFCDSFLSSLIFLDLWRKLWISLGDSIFLCAPWILTRIWAISLVSPSLSHSRRLSRLLQAPRRSLLAPPSLGLLCSLLVSHPIQWRSLTIGGFLKSSCKWSAVLHVFFIGFHLLALTMGDVSDEMYR